MTGEEIRRNPVEELAEEFLQRYRRGERPALSEYTGKYPDLADEIRDLFPALVMMEEAGQPALPQRRLNQITEDGRVPQQLGEYRILREVGRGGMGVVYEAEHAALGRHVALKVLPFEAAANPTSLERFRREARSAARLHHTNIVPVFDVGEHQGIPYYAMQFIQGQSLGEIFAELRQLRGRREPTGCNLTADLADSLLTGRCHAEAAAGTVAVVHPPSDLSAQSDFHYYRSVARLGQQAAEALAYAHDHKILHRDIKPANLLLDLQGTVWVTDFGLAKEEGDDLTHTGDVVGTLRYMAPERFNGVSDARSDVYSLGVTLYELLTLRPAFDGVDRGQLMCRIADVPLLPPRRSDPRVPRDLETIVLKAIEKEPGRRYQSAEALAEDLRRFLADRPIEARRANRLERTWRWCRRNPAVAGLLTLAGVLALATVVVSVVSAWRLGVEAERARQAEHSATEKLLKVTLARAQALRKSGEMGQRFQSLAALEEAIEIARSLGVLDEYRVALRNEAIACLSLADLQVAEEWQPARPLHPWALSATVEASLKRLLYLDQASNLSVIAMDSRLDLVRLPAPEKPVRGMAFQWSRDGRYLAITYHQEDGARFQVWDLNTTPPAVAVGPLKGVGSFTLRADGRLLAVCHPDASLGLFDLERGGHRSFPNIHCRIMAFRPDGKLLAYNTHGDQTLLHVLDLESGHVLRRVNQPGEIKSLAWSADGRLLAAGCDDRNVHVLDAEQWLPQSTLEGHQGGVEWVAFSPVSELLASSSLDGTTRLWDPIDGRQLVSAVGRSLQFSADGRRLAFRRGGRVGIWEVADGSECRVLHHGRVGRQAQWRGYKGPQMLDFSPEGRLLVSAAPDGVRLWDTANCREVAHLHAGHHEAARFHPDGTLYTFGRTGVRAWPIRAERAPGTLRVGPPQLLVGREAEDWFRGCVSGDGRLIFACQHVHDHEDRVYMFPANRPGERVLLAEGMKLTTLTTTPDGGWVAGSALVEGQWGIQVWDTRTRRRGPFLGDLCLNATFSPDGRQLAGAGPGWRTWDVGSWVPARAVSWEQRLDWAGPGGFCPDGRVFAAPRAIQDIQLSNFLTRAEIATLPAPDRASVWWPCFSPDGLLLATATESHGVHLWNLGALGQKLRTMGLGCELLPDAPTRVRRTLTRVRVFQDLQEAEYITAQSESWGTHVQDVKRWGKHWSNDKQLICNAQKGSYVELTVDVPETGAYRLAACLSRSWNFAVIQVALDGKNIGTLFDGLNATDKLPVERVDYGTYELCEGPHRLRFTAVDKNPKSAAYCIGIDYIQLTPVDTPRKRESEDEQR